MAKEVKELTFEEAVEYFNENPELMQKEFDYHEADYILARARIYVSDISAIKAEQEAKNEK